MIARAVSNSFRRKAIWLFAVALLTACGQDGDIERPSGPRTEWSSFGGSMGGGHYSEANEITPENVHALELAWVHQSGDVRPPPTAGVGAINGPLQQTSFIATPILTGNKLYYCTPFNRVFALDAASGREIWVFDPEVDMSEENMPLCRGVSLWIGSGAEKTCARRIITGTLDARLIVIDAETGAPCSDFGVNGVVDLKAGLTPHSPKEYNITSPPAILGDAVIVSGLVADSFRKDVPAGVVRAFDVRTGALLWAWNAVPPGTPELNEDGTYRTGTANVWSLMSVDRERNIVFLPTGNAGPDFYGGDREGMDYYSSSIVALNATTGELIWHYQTVHHDIWDYDVPSQPTLVDLDVDGHAIPALVQVTKMGLTFVLNRETGEPVFPIVERPAPQEGTVPGENLSPTQPVPTLPEALHEMSITPDDAWGFTFWDRGKCRETLSALNSGPIYTPPSLKGSTIFPSTLGGNDWGAPAVDPVRKLMVVNTNHVPLSIKLHPRSECAALKPDLPQTGSAYCAVIIPVFSPLGAPCSKPPWATLETIDLTTGKILWKHAMGQLGPSAMWPISMMGGGFSIGGPMITATGLIFIGASTDFALRAYNLETGEELWKAGLPTTANSVPMTYRLNDNSRQFVVVAAGGHFGISGMAPPGDYLMAFALPE